MHLTELMDVPHKELPRLLKAGYSIDPRALDNTLYRGVSLGLPWWAEALSWKTFAKTFYRGDDDGLYGWNVRLEQTGIQGPIVPKTKGKHPQCFGFYGVTGTDGYHPPHGTEQGLLIQYRFGPNARISPLNWVRDPLVAIHQDDPSLLLGWSYIHFLGGIWTPSYFALKAESPLDYVPDVMTAWTRPKAMLSA